MATKRRKRKARRVGRGQTVQFLKALRKKHGLGEFSKKRRRPRAKKRARRFVSRIFSAASRIGASRRKPFSIGL